LKTRIKIVALKLATVGLAVAALAAPARAGQLLPNGRATANGLSAVNELRPNDDPGMANDLQSINGLCPSFGPCSSAA
jgi:hypothetical protein